MKRKIRTSELQVGMYVVGVDAAWFDHPIWRPGTVLDDPQVVVVLKAARIDEVWIDTSRGLAPPPGSDVMPPPAPPAPPTAPFEAPGKIVQEVELPAAPPVVQRVSAFADDLIRARKLCIDARQEVASMFDSVRTGRAITEQDVLPLVDEITLAVEEIPGAFLSVARLKNHDNYTYLHSVAVCGLMAALARQLELEIDQARNASIGGLLHDLGKALVDQDILLKPGALDPQEFEVIKKHPRFGYELLLQQPFVTGPSRDVVLHHHEKVNGGGYPDQLSGSDIPVLARMGAVCDVYDAITSNRPYKEGWDPAIAIRRMAQWKGHFDEVIFRQFIATVGIFPVGSLVALESGRLAIVLRSGSSSLSRPIVRAFFSIKNKEPVAIETIDLGHPSCKDRIIGPEDPAQWGFDRLEKVLEA